jgi:hypothetical protein
VSRLLQELTQLAELPVDRLGSDGEEGGDGDLRQAQPVVQGGGQEPVGEGEYGSAAGARGGQAGAVAAAVVQARLAALLVQGDERGEQGVPLGFG